MSNFRTFSEIFRRLPKISEEDPMLFRSHSNTANFRLRYYVTMAIVIFSISFHVKDKNSIFTPRDKDIIF